MLDAKVHPLNIKTWSLFFMDKSLICKYAMVSIESLDLERAHFKGAISNSPKLFFSPTAILIE